MKETKKIKQSISKVGLAIIVVALVIVLPGVLLGYGKTVEKITTQKTMEDLTAVTKQEDVILKQIVDAELNRLQIIAMFFEKTGKLAGDSWKDVICDTDADIRTGIADNKGKLHRSNGEVLEIADKSYYQKVMAGATVVSNVEFKSGNEKNTITFAYPIYNGRKVVGAVCSEYTTDRINKVMNVTRSKNLENSVIVQKDGQILVGNISGYDNLFSFLQSLSHKNNDLVEEFKTSLEGSMPFSMIHKGKGRVVYLYCDKTGVKGWYTVSFVMEQGYQRALANIETQGYIAIGISMGVAICILLFGIFLIREYKNEARDAKRDALTGACNRELAKLLMMPCFRWYGKKKRHACMYMDIDFFKKINDIYGHKEGDIALQKLADILQESVHKGDVVARFGGDEFCIWLKNIPSEEKMMEVVDFIFYRVRKETKFTISMGIAMFPQNGINYEELIRRADEALYMAKRAGRNRYCFYKKKEGKSE